MRIADAKASETQTSVDDEEFRFWDDYTFTWGHVFIDEDDGEVFEIEAGSTFHAYR
jgi:hypothetical protein